ncbi:hypothetical protein H5410_024775 [Solanum commersonii]|uniref:Uncharacterized protein n=1 Tax=Solanum commersonii TaxID=4109 RepID=A0A9J5ZMX7_SOLCO|nr:hypothetical protein H5410_024775 [Solanum commersonii]
MAPLFHMTWKRILWNFCMKSEMETTYSLLTSGINGLPRTMELKKRSKTDLAKHLERRHSTNIGTQNSNKRKRPASKVQQQKSTTNEYKNPPSLQRYNFDFDDDMINRGCSKENLTKRELRKKM